MTLRINRSNKGFYHYTVYLSCIMLPTMPSAIWSDYVPVCFPIFKVLQPEVCFMGLCRHLLLEMS